MTSPAWKLDVIVDGILLRVRPQRLLGDKAPPVRVLAFVVDGEDDPYGAVRRNRSANSLGILEVRSAPIRAQHPMAAIGGLPLPSG